MTGALGLGTLVFPYSLVFNNHLPTAASLLLGFYALLRARAGDPSAARWLMLAGFATALAFTFDLLVVPFLALFLGIALIRYRLRVGPFLIGAVIPLALLAALDWWSLGDPLPPSMHSSGFDYSTSLFPATLTGNVGPDNVLAHGLLMLFGNQGLFSLNPVMLWAVLGLWVVFRERGHRLWGEVVAAALAILVTFVCLVLFTPGFGGVAYGTRWFLDFSPLLMFFAIWPALHRLWWQRALFITLAAVSVVSAWQGAIAPWKLALPPFRLTAYTLSGIGQYLGRLPQDAVLYTTPGHARVLPVASKHAWGLTLHEFDPAAGTLPVGDPARPAVYVVDTDDRTTGGLLEAALPQGWWDVTVSGYAIYRVPSGVNRVRPRQPLQADFARQIRLLGCDVLAASLRPGDIVTVRLSWQALSPIYHRYTAFVHLLGPTPNPATGNSLWAQDDHQPGHTTYPTDRWFPGEVVLDWFRFVVPDNAPPGEYVLTTGFYDLATLQRLARSDVEGDTATLPPVTVMP